MWPFKKKKLKKFKDVHKYELKIALKYRDALVITGTLQDPKEQSETAEKFRAWLYYHKSKHFEFILADNTEQIGIKREEITEYRIMYYTVKEEIKN